LPHRKLRDLQALIVRTRSMARTPAAAPRFEALLAATLMHLEPGDFVSPPAGAPHAAALIAERIAPAGRKKSKSPAPEPALPATQRLAAAAGIARGLKLAKSDRMSVVYIDAGPATARTEPGWAESLAFASTGELPLIIVCADATGGAGSSNAKSLTWPNLVKVAARAKLPVLTVDGEDAVAVYRCMQEASLRARMGAGSALLYAVLTPGPKVAALTRSQLPQARLESYLKTRNIPF
jgi:hypothetical protein